MNTSLRVGCALAAVLVCQAAAPRDARTQTTAELDAYWAEVSRTVTAGDFEGYAALYHEDAVLVSTLSGESYPIAQALGRWKPDFDDTRARRTRASVRFRFSQRLNDATTAHETGIFNYRLETAAGEVHDQYFHFQALLVKRDGWKMVMEYQMSAATSEEWDALEPPAGSRLTASTRSPASGRASAPGW